MSEPKRLLIANRGEIALRIARTAQDQGWESVAVFAPEDRDLSAGYGTRESVELPGRGAAAYLDAKALVDAARATGCDALHPGYGFLSESPLLARACDEAGIRFVGPSAATLERFGDKDAARQLANRLDVPIVPGIAAPASLDEVRAFAEALPAGSAFLLKAVAGGGGRGMRRIEPGEDVAQAYARCASEAERAFGSGALYAERWVAPARHIEIQIVADAAGAVGHLWDRDCSVQRRHQKLVELAPAPGVDASVRARLIDAARRLAGEAGLVGVGTFEFLLRDDGEFFFIEANPRLQVEHTVTEEITGRDLVAIQLALAEGASLASLGLAEPPPIRGSAVQLRILAERLDDDGTSRPAAGRLDRWQPPSGPGVRVDSAMRTGLGPHPAFDSLLGKLILAAPSADATILRRRVDRALRTFDIGGVEQNLGVLAAICARPEVLEGQVSTTWFEAEATRLHAEADAWETDASATAAAADTPAANGPAASAALLAEGEIAIAAPLVGTLLEWQVEPGDSITAGQTLCVLESMKMEHVVEATTGGLFSTRHVEVGAVVQEAQPLGALRPDAAATTVERDAEALDLDAIRPDLAEVRTRHALLEDAKRPTAVERRRKRGQRTARENLASVCDADTFAEYGALAIAAMKRVRPVEELQAQTPGDAIITGTGAVNGDLFDAKTARCALLVVDATVLAGTQGYFHHKKIDRILEIAEAGSLPVVFYPEGGGGRPNDTDASDVFVAGLNITSFHHFAKLSGKVPRVAVVSGYCFAGSAAFAGCADVIIATRDACLGMGGPAMIEGGGLGVFAPTEVGPTSVQWPNGVIDILVEDEEEAAVAARRYLSYFQGRVRDWTAPDPRRLRHAIPENRRRVYDLRALIEGLFDLDSVLELRRGWAPGMLTALARIEGRPVGVVANDPSFLGGAIDDEGAEKAARFLQLCDVFGLPVVSLCDTPGFMVGPDIEARQQVRKVSRLFTVGANVRIPLFCVITRKAYGLGAQAMAGGGLHAAFDTVAWPTGEIGGMGLEGAVNLGFKKQLEACDSEKERQALFEKLVGVMYDKGKAMNAAAALEFDAVIDPADTRARLVQGLEAFGTIPRSPRGFVDTW